MRNTSASRPGSIPLYNVAGNHDVGTAATKDSLAGYRTRFGPDYFAFETPDVVGLVLNTSLIKTVQGLEEEKGRQKTWFEGELRKAGMKRRRVLLFQHIPWFVADPDEAEKYENIGPAARREYLDLLRSSTVSHVFAGHRHLNGRAKIGAIEMVIVGPVGKPLGPDPSGILFVTVGAEGLTCRYIALDDLPARRGGIRSLDSPSRASAGFAPPGREFRSTEFFSFDEYH